VTKFLKLPMHEAKATTKGRPASLRLWLIHDVCKADHRLWGSNCWCNSFCRIV